MKKKRIIKITISVILGLLITKNLCFAVGKLDSSESDKYLEGSSGNSIGIEVEQSVAEIGQNSNKNQLPPAYKKIANSNDDSNKNTPNKTGYKMTNPFENPGEFDPTKDPQVAGKDSILEKAGKVLGTIQVIGIVIAVIVITILGIKYMVGSVEEKAEYKKTMIPYIVGVAFLVSITTIVPIFAKLVLDIIK